MKYTEVNIGGYNAKVSSSLEGKPLIEVPSDYVDSEGNTLTKEAGKSTQAVYKNKDGMIVEQKYKLINGRVLNKFKLVKEVPKDKIKEVDKTETFDVIEKSCHKVECEPLREKLADKAWKFAFSWGNGFDISTAYLTTFGGELIMRLSKGKLSEALLQAVPKIKVAEIKEEVTRANSLMDEIAV